MTLIGTRALILILAILAAWLILALVIGWGVRDIGYFHHPSCVTAPPECI